MQHIGNRVDYRKYVRQMIEYFQNYLDDDVNKIAAYANVLEDRYSPAIEIFIIGKQTDKVRYKMLRSLSKNYLPLNSIKIFNPHENGVIKRNPLTFYFNGSTLCYVSIDGKIWGPYYEIDDLLKKVSLGKIGS